MFLCFLLFQIDESLVQTLPHSVGLAKIIESGTYIVTMLPNNVRVKFNGFDMKICVPETYKRDMGGMCGNYDDNLSNDMVTSYGTIQTNNQHGWNIIGDSHHVYDEDDAG